MVRPRLFANEPGPHGVVEFGEGVFGRGHLGGLSGVQGVVNEVCDAGILAYAKAVAKMSREHRAGGGDFRGGRDRDSHNPYAPGAH